MTSKAEGMADCCCGRIGSGYALVLCQEHAPIPYTLTTKGERAARRMKQWDAIFSSLEESRRMSPRSRAARQAWGTRRAKQAVKA